MGPLLFKSVKRYQFWIHHSFSFTWLSEPNLVLHYSHIGINFCPVFKQKKNTQCDIIGDHYIHCPLQMLIWWKKTTSTMQMTCWSINRLSISTPKLLFTTTHVLFPLAVTDSQHLLHVLPAGFSYISNPSTHWCAVHVPNRYVSQNMYNPTDQQEASSAIEDMKNYVSSGTIGGTHGSQPCLIVVFVWKDYGNTMIQNL